MGSVQQFKPHLWSCPGLCVLELQRGEAGLGARDRHTLVGEARKSPREGLRAPTRLFPGPQGETREDQELLCGREGPREGFPEDVLPSHWFTESSHS